MSLMPPSTIHGPFNGQREAQDKVKDKAKELADTPGKVAAVYHMQRVFKVEAIQTVDASVWSPHGES